MARLFGFMSNRTDLGPALVRAERDALAVRAAEGKLGWGVGFYQGGEPLLRKRPSDERAVIDVAEATDGIATDALVGHVRVATVGAVRAENTHPFRYRQWLFAHTGTVEGFSALRERMLASVPEFLRRSVRGDTDSEVVFCLFLSFLHDAGRLDTAAVEPRAAREALHKTLAWVDRAVAETGATDGRSNLAVTDGEHLYAVHRGATMALRTLATRAEVLRALGPEGAATLRLAEGAACRVSLFGSDFDATPTTWTLVPPRSMVTLGRTDDPTIEPL